MSTSTTSTTITTQGVQSLPKSINFSSLLRISSGVANPRSGQFQVDGASGSENSFVIDGQELANSRTANANASNSVMHLDGKTVLVVRPDYPARAKNGGRCCGRYPGGCIRQCRRCECRVRCCDVSRRGRAGGARDAVRTDIRRRQGRPSQGHADLHLQTLAKGRCRPSCDERRAADAR